MLGFSVLIALSIRVIPAYKVVMTDSGVNFQDTDSWYHMRAVHNTAAHFPQQSGFDPYAIFPGRPHPYSEPWDLAIAAAAGVLGLGGPSEQLINQVGAWLPALLGALLPVPLFFLARRLAGEEAARWAAFAVAVIPGTLVWETHLGVPDHHVAECLLSVGAVALLCGALESEWRARLWRLAAAGSLFGVYLCVRPAGIFVPATLAIAALLEPLLAPFVAACLAMAAGFFLIGGESVWANYTWLTLAGSIGACLAAWALAWLWRKRAWPKALLFPAVVCAAGLAISLLAAAQPPVFGALMDRIRGYLPGSHSVAQSFSVGEILPLWAIRADPAQALLEMLGTVWLPAVPVLFCGAFLIWRTRRPVVVLCAVWGLVMTVGGVLQTRMWIYGAPALALAAGVGCAWLMARLPRFQLVISLVTAGLLAATSIPHGIQQSGLDSGPRAEWREALTWLRRNTPEPMGDPNAWLGYWPALKPDQNFAYPTSAYGVLTWWDYGDWVNAISHRMPSTNGTQANADLVAAYLTATSPRAAQRALLRLSARYAVLNSEVTLDFWRNVVEVTKRNPEQYQRAVFELGPDGERRPILIYMPDYFRTMAVRMYNFDGRAIVAGPVVSVFTVLPGQQAEAVVSERRFPSEAAARKFMESNPGEQMFLGSRDPMMSCVDIEQLTEVKRIFASAETAGLRAVKVFELLPY